MGPQLIAARPPAPARRIAWATFATALCAALAVGSNAVRGAGHDGHKGSAGAAGKSVLGVVSLDVYRDRSARLHLLTAERLATGAAPVLRYARSDDGGQTWSPPVALGGGQPAPDPVKRGNDAQIVAAGDRVLAVWTTGAATKMGRGPLAASASSDGGRTWSPAPPPSDATGVIDHAFSDLAADEHGNFHAVWLDARPTAEMLSGASAANSAPGAGGTASAGPSKGLRYARSGDGGRTWSKNVTLDAQCCECCWNNLLVLPGGLVHVLYRDRDPRDMALISSADGGRTWSTPAPVGAFEWGFHGCPHVGGALAAGDDGRSLNAVVWTAKGGDAVGVFALSGTTSAGDLRPSFAPPVQLGGPQSNRPDIARGANGRVATVWDAYVESIDARPGGNATFAATSTDGGTTWSAPVRLSAPGASATHPRVLAVGKAFRAFWTQQEPGKPVTWTSRVVE